MGQEARFGSATLPVAVGGFCRSGSTPQTGRLVGGLCPRTGLSLVSQRERLRATVDLPCGHSPHGWHTTTFPMGIGVGSLLMALTALAKSSVVFAKYDAFCCAQNGPMTRHVEGASPSWGCNRRVTKSGGHFRRNPLGGRSFGQALRCVSLTDPLGDMRGRRASFLAKTPGRRMHRISQTPH